MDFVQSDYSRRSLDFTARDENEGIESYSYRVTFFLDFMALRDSAFH